MGRRLRLDELLEFMPPEPLALHAVPPRDFEVEDSAELDWPNVRLPTVELPKAVPPAFPVQAVSGLPRSDLI
eukprot:9056183-Alexandrium_andersonii.AAC.1